jgi:hypothetical protein
LIACSGPQPFCAVPPRWQSPIWHPTLLFDLNSGICHQQNCRGKVPKESPAGEGGASLGLIMKRCGIVHTAPIQPSSPERVPRLPTGQRGQHRQPRLTLLPHGAPRDADGRLSVSGGAVAGLVRIENDDCIDDPLPTNHLGSRAAHETLSGLQSSLSRRRRTVAFHHEERRTPYFRLDHHDEGNGP